jgi:ABC-type multidrug transport system permease subunit
MHAHQLILSLSVAGFGQYLSCFHWLILGALFVYTTFYFAGIANFLLLFGGEEGIKPSPAAAIVR